MNVSDIMTAGVVSVKPSTQVYQIAKLLSEHRISAVPVVDENQRLLGIVSEGDLLHRSELGTEHKRSWWLALLSDKETKAHDYAKSHALKAEDLMTTDLVTAKEDTPLQEVADLLERNQIKRVPIMRDDKVVGLVSRANLIQALAMRGLATTNLDNKVDDSTIKDTLKRVLHEDLGVNLATVNFQVENGVVHLWGIVDGNEESKAIRIAAENVPGVQKVDCKLKLYRAGVTYGV